MPTLDSQTEARRGIAAKLAAANDEIKRLKSEGKMLSQRSVSASACPECNYGGHNPPGHRHAPTCSLIDHETAKRQLKYYYEVYNRRESLWANIWENEKKRAKILRHENNRLREKLRKAAIIK